MLERASATQVLGLERAGTHVRGVLLHYRRSNIECEKSYILDGREEGLQELQTTDVGRALLRETRHALVATAMEGGQTVVRQLDVKLKKEKDIDAVLNFQAEPLLPFSIEEGIVDRAVVEVGEEGTLLTVLAVRRDHLQAHLDEWSRLGIQPEVVGAVAQALMTYVKTFLKEENDPLLVIDVGQQTTQCALVRKGKLLAAQAYRGGVEELLVAHRRDKELDEKEEVALTEVDCRAEVIAKMPLLAKQVTQLQRDAVRTSFGLAKYAHIGDVVGVVVTGEGTLCPDLSDGLAKAIGKPLLPMQAPATFGLESKAFVRLAVPIGIALTALPKQMDQVNFRQGNMAYPHPWKRLRTPLALALLLSITLAGATYFFGDAYLGWKQDGLRSSYVELVADLKRDYEGVEKQLIATTGSSEETSLSPLQLTPGAIERRLKLFEKEMSAAPDTIALFPHVPRVSDVLVWLGSHPQVSLNNGASHGAQIYLDSFSYRMIKRPELNKPRERYQVQVELEFTSQSPRAARLFYDALIAPNEIIDPKGEVKWTAANGKYRVAFFLKDKTAYPNP